MCIHHIDQNVQLDQMINVSQKFHSYFTLTFRMELIFVFLMGRDTNIRLSIASLTSSMCKQRQILVSSSYWGSTRYVIWSVNVPLKLWSLWHAIFKKRPLQFYLFPWIDSNCTTNSRWNFWKEKKISIRFLDHTEASADESNIYDDHSLLILLKRNDS